jgi:hypothetical protein
MCRFNRIEPTHRYSLHRPASGWATDSIGKPIAGLHTITSYFIAGDTAKLRQNALTYENDSRQSASLALADFGYSVIAADAYLAAHDSVSALRMARFFVDTAMRFTTFGTSIRGVIPMNGAAFIPRMMLMRADLAAGLGSREEARKWYARALDLWADADPELAPVVTRMRASLAALGPPGK